LIYCKLIGEIYVQYNIKNLEIEGISFPSDEKTLTVSIWIKPSSDENRVHPSWSLTLAQRAECALSHE